MCLDLSLFSFVLNFFQQRHNDEKFITINLSRLCYHNIISTQIRLLPPVSIEKNCKNSCSSSDDEDDGNYYDFTPCTDFIFPLLYASLLSIYLSMES